MFVSSDEIAGCIEKAYEQIQFNEATRVLFFSSPKKMTEYAKKVSVHYTEHIGLLSLDELYYYRLQCLNFVTLLLLPNEVLCQGNGLALCNWNIVWLLWGVSLTLVVSL